MAKAIEERWQCEYTRALRKLVDEGVPRGRTDEALLDIVRLSLKIARDAFKRIDGKRIEQRD